MAVNKQIRILVVDDFQAMRRIIKDILKKIGYPNVLEAEDGVVAWEILMKNKIDLVISDWNMPRMTGIELLRKVRAHNDYANVPFLIVSAECEQENIVEAIKAKVSNYMVKPFTQETMEQKIEKIFEG